MSTLRFYGKNIIVLLLLVSYNTVIGNSPVKIYIDQNSDSSLVFQDNDITVHRKWDEASSTYYFLSRIKHKDENGDLLQLKLAIAVVDSGETVPQFASRLGNPMIAINASTVLSNKPPWPKVSSGFLIVEGRVLQATPTSKYVLGIKQNNELVAYKPGTKAKQMLSDGAVYAVTGFTPLIQDFKPVDDEVIGIIKNQFNVHPRQVIAQFSNLDLLFLSCGGRGYDGAGMRAADIIRILQGLEGDVKFAYNLDGGGSTTTVVYGNQITPMIDKRGTQNRTRSNCLYVAPNK